MVDENKKKLDWVERFRRKKEDSHGRMQPPQNTVLFLDISVPKPPLNPYRHMGVSEN